MVVQENFFDMYDFLVNELIGNPQLATIVGSGVIIYLSLKFGIPSKPTFTLLGIFLLMMYSQTSIAIILVFVVLLAGLFFYMGLHDKFK